MVLVAKDLTSAEVSFLRALVRLSSELAGQWVVQDDGDCDVLLAGNGGDSANQTRSYAAKVVVPVLPRGEVATGQVLVRPFRAEDFIGLLKRIEAALLGASDTTQAAQQPGVIPTGDKAQLRRWPPAQLLGNSRTRVQLATMLSRGPRSANELSLASGRPVDECAEFLGELHQRQLLIWQSTTPNQTPAPVSKQVPARADAKAGLLHSIRRRLGLV